MTGYRAKMVLTMMAAALTLAACGGAETVAVPEIVGEEEGFARGVLIGRGLSAVVVEEEVLDVPEGQILRQEPASGEEVDVESDVTIYVAVSPRFEVIGTFTLTDIGNTRGSDTNCFGDGGYDDIRSGVSVTVRDGAGAVLGTGRLGDGVKDLWCTFNFTVADLPKVDFYSVEVGRRGELTYSFDEMETSGWKVDLSIG